MNRQSKKSPAIRQLIKQAGALGRGYQVKQFGCIAKHLQTSFRTGDSRRIVKDLAATANAALEALEDFARIDAREGVTWERIPGSSARRSLPNKNACFAMHQVLSRYVEEFTRLSATFPSVFKSIAASAETWPGQITNAPDLKRHNDRLVQRLELGKKYPFRFRGRSDRLNNYETRIAFHLCRALEWERGRGRIRLAALSRRNWKAWWTAADALFRKYWFPGEFENKLVFRRHWESKAFEGVPEQQKRALIRRQIKLLIRQAIRSMAPM